MKFLINTADLDEVREAMGWDALSGMIINPNPYVKIGGKLAGFEQHMMKICEICEGLPVSAEPTVTMVQEMVEEGRRFAGLVPNVVVELPIGVEDLAAAKMLAEDGVAVNMTLVFSAPQALLAARVGARHISPFVERVDDIGSDGVVSLEEIMHCTRNYDSGHEYEIIATLIRSPCHVTAAVLIGVDIATVPFGALKNCVKHPLMVEGLVKLEANWGKVKNAQVGAQVRRRRLEQRSHVPVLEEGTVPRHSERVWRLDG